MNFLSDSSSRVRRRSHELEAFQVPGEASTSITISASESLICQSQCLTEAESGELGARGPGVQEDSETDSESSQNCNEQSRAESLFPPAF
eukprot:1478100-Rhodomonas_salina.1